ncbi:DUF2683 family protein (plasmid) [Flavobacterium sp. TMP13]|uniref:DUF2683 family protein n=1 Tax=Flavobacterium sp. TMP13 TaxID=3425950 RepID=UPI003D77FDEF
MATLEITSREFREKQKDFFDKADEGENVVIRRGKKQAYALVPISTEDLYFTPEMIKKIDLSIQQIKEGKFTAINSKEELKKHLDSL